MTIIKANEVQQGDRIKVTRTDQDGDRKTVRIFEGVAHTYEEYLDAWRTAESWNLFTGYDGAVIELLDRPKPKVKLPTGVGATIVYNKPKDRFEQRRVAVLDDKGRWQSHRPNGEWRDGRSSEALVEWFQHGDAADLKVIFEGVAK